MALDNKFTAQAQREPHAAAGCCAPARAVDAAATALAAPDLGAGERTSQGRGGTPPAPAAAAPYPPASAVEVPGGTFLMGSDDKTFPDDHEGPIRPVTVAPFAIDRFAVSNQRFARFVAATGYRTEAERFGWSFVFYDFLPEDHPPTKAVAAAPWWRAVEGADWRHPLGPATNATERPEHPVVHVSWRDAAAFAAWAGGRLPLEAEWEYAGRGGFEQRRFPWGDRLVEGRRHRCNVWQGEFPKRDHARDGYHGTAPVDAFEPNGYGLYNVVGNVWEWCADRWDVLAGDSSEAPVDQADDQAELRVMKGGSYLCHASYCNRYRLAARTASTADSATGHVGFRVAYDLH